MQGEAGIFSALKRTLLAMALLVTPVFGVTGCGSDGDVQVESRAKNAAPEVPESINASGGPPPPPPGDAPPPGDDGDFGPPASDGPKADCDLDDLRDLLRYLDDRHELLDLLDECHAVWGSGTDSPKGDDVEGG